MARSFTSLFFKAAKKLSKLQRAAMRMAAPKSARKRTPSVRKAAAKPAPPAATPRQPAAPSLGGGRWESSRQFSDGAGRQLTFARYTPVSAPRAGMPLVAVSYTHLRAHET